MPAFAGDNKGWALQANLSDDFNYSFIPDTVKTSFGFDSLTTKWNNHFINNWNGPGPTIWRPDHVRVKDGNLEIWVDRVAGEVKDITGGVEPPFPVTRTGCVSSKEAITYPVFIETKLRVLNSTLASAVWMLSVDSRQEIDIIEAYGGLGSDGRNAFFAERIHLSHHVFIREPFSDYQPRDWNSWYTRNNVNQWGNVWVRVGVYWASSTRLEYYIDGELVRILDDTAIASKLPNGTWKYMYPAGFDANTGLLKFAANGFQDMKIANSLEEAKSLSNISVIDAYDFLGNGKQLDNELHIIVSIEDQEWLALAGRSPTDEELLNTENNTKKIDWIRVYKPVDLVCQIEVADSTGNQIINSLRASNYIKSNGFIETGSNIIYKAGNYLEFYDSFDVKLGAAFEARIDGCSN